ncbi:MAG: hypothetical protein CVU18_06465 [Betaproteobacteria bacterium HGW-Betaproteobacteria-12]|nr:MAG: hypothetical protein CVU18_06465 [Betaproteobacteria bacterium HGW-Betaproteobacteria-12]
MKSQFTLSAALLMVVATAALAGDDHDHGAPAVAAAAPSLPVITAVSESFELVGRLHADELSILIDRADSNEPVLHATLTVDVDGRSIAAPFHADHGDYALADPAALSTLRQVGSKPLTFTLLAGEESDLLTGELDVHAEDPAVAAHLHSWPEYLGWAGGAFAGLATLGLLVRRRRAASQHATGGAA